MPGPAFSDLLCSHRARRGLSLSELALLADISRSHLSNLERGRRMPSGAHAKALGQALELDAEAFLIWLAAAAESHIPADLRDYRA